MSILSKTTSPAACRFLCTMLSTFDRLDRLKMSAEDDRDAKQAQNLIRGIIESNGFTITYSDKTRRYSLVAENNGPKVFEFLYRDGANYKECVTILVHPTHELYRRKIKEGDEVTIEELGFTVGHFFNHFMPNAYNPDYDHNILEFIETTAPADKPYLINLM